MSDESALRVEQFSATLVNDDVDGTEWDRLSRRFHNVIDEAERDLPVTVSVTMEVERER